jgi:hypothetical protein
MTKKEAALPLTPSGDGPRAARALVYSVKQLTAGYDCISEWHGSAFTWPFAPGEQKKLKRLPLNQRILGSSPKGLTTQSLISTRFARAVSNQGYGSFVF